MKTKENKKGISLIVLVITIIVIIILATAVIVTILDNNPINSAKKAVDDSNIAKYTEQIEQVRSKLLLQNENHELPNLSQMKEALEKEKWVVETEMIMDEGIEKLKIVSKEGYIFYITEDDVEYKGKGEVVDISALKRDDVLELVAEDTTAKGQYVKITSKAEEYYVIKYKIGEENSQTEIKSGERVEVPYGKTIYAKLFYGSSSGVEFKLKIGESNPSIVAKNTDTSNMKRKTDNAFASLFDITWGSEGTGNIAYEVTGNMLFKNTSYNNTSIENTKELELGTYNVKCTITSPSGYTTNAQKQVVINQLASTSVIIESGSNINANAIYSEYDMAYFRDLINKGNNSFNARLMNDIDLANVCSIKNGSWIPIGDKGVYGNNNINEDFVFKGIFDGDYHKVTNLYINNDEQMLSLFKINCGKVCKLQLISGNITSKNFTSSLVSWNKSIISECCNYIDILYNSSKFIAGITSYNEGTISYCYNVGNISGIDSIGGIVANNADNGIIEYCYNSGQISGDNDQIGGIVGANFGVNGGINRGIVRNSYNIGNITGSSRVGAIVGGNGGAGTYYGGTVENCYFLNSSYSTAIGHSYSALKELTYSQTAEQMKSFRINNIFIEDNANKNNGYPILKWQLDH